MAGYSARQSSFTTGDTILAAHSNDEINQVLAAFHATTGHSHDGTAGEGGPVSTLRDADSLNKISRQARSILKSTYSKPDSFRTKYIGTSGSFPNGGFLK